MLTFSSGRLVFLSAGSVSSLPLWGERFLSSGPSQELAHSDQTEEQTTGEQALAKYRFLGEVEPLLGKEG